MLYLKLTTPHKRGKNRPKTRQKAEERKIFILAIFPFQTVKNWGFCVRKIGKKDRFRLKPQIGEKKIDEKIGKRLRRSTASVKCGNVKMVPFPMFPSATHSGAYFPIPIGGRAALFSKQSFPKKLG